MYAVQNRVKEGGNCASSCDRYSSVQKGSNSRWTIQTKGVMFDGSSPPLAKFRDEHTPALRTDSIVSPGCRRSDR
jgi:hypothetical protein